MSDVAHDRAVAAAAVAPPKLPATSLAAVLDGCSVLEINVWLYEHEKAGMRLETWPGDAQRQAAIALADWQTRNPGRELRAVTTAIVPAREGGRNAVMLVHHALKAGT